MTKESIAVIGGGIVGSTAAYYLARAGYDVTLFDEGTGQATSAAAGIICPWFTLRRNKPWYFLVSQGAEFYRQLMRDLAEDGFETAHIFKEQGALIIRKNQKSLDRDIEASTVKKETAPAIQTVKTLSPQESNKLFPMLETQYSATHVQGGGRVDGAALIDTLKQAFTTHGGQLITQTAQLTPEHLIKYAQQEAQHFDKILLAAGAWLPDLLEPLDYDVDIRPQKGQLFSIQTTHDDTDNWPVIMPPGKVDIIPNPNGEIVIGATHEDDMGYDLELDYDKLAELSETAKNWIPSIETYSIHNTRVGIRAYTSDYTVLVGQVPETNNIWAVSGLGSSGLTSGPYLGYQWAQLIQTGKWTLNEDDFPINKFIQKRHV
ncbi:FAD-dependent oxidoreductase [Aerococcaceae bacterium zg-BR22]|uniref:NAD(P)/FAD-dependent oxidoreductase n=1 Tax=Aerococcaceae bacterium zg-1292 TaxID=2774330 RepID=UPI004064C88A|nr:FAD-dependent oxidoreductase [Aerococcaceae bacterium zg-BR22]